MLNRLIGLSLGALLSALPCIAAAPDSGASVKINQIQVIGTHNSYHAGLASSEAKLLEQKNPKLYQALEYRHRPLDEQLTSGVRQIELDIYADSAGGRYAHPMGIDAVVAATTVVIAVPFGNVLSPWWLIVASLLETADGFPAG